jgi:hypothetical protein
VVLGSLVIRLLVEFVVTVGPVIKIELVVVVESVVVMARELSANLSTPSMINVPSRV